VHSKADGRSGDGLRQDCQQPGLTPRGLVDRMIAAVAWRHPATLLACDADLDRVARIMGIEMDEASRQR
jgi:predicted nucleic acid-binding protein